MMYHSIIFNDGNSIRNTWDDWHIVPSSRPVFNPPKQKTNYIDIPGADSIIDASEFLTEYPVYNNREGSIEFIVVNGYKDWSELYSEIMNYVHGRELIAVLEDDMEHYYVGRFSINQWRSEQHYSKITIDYNVRPYKYCLLSSLENEVLKEEFCDIAVDSDEEVEKVLDSSLVGRMPVCPTFKIASTDSAGIDIRLVNSELGIDISSHFDDGDSMNVEFMLSGISSSNELKLYLKGHGTVSVEFRGGSL